MHSSFFESFIILRRIHLVVKRFLQIFFCFFYGCVIFLFTFLFNHNDALFLPLSCVIMNPSIVR